MLLVFDLLLFYDLSISEVVRGKTLAVNDDILGPLVFLPERFKALSGDARLLSC